MSDRHRQFTVRPITTAQTYDLRRRVLRAGTPSTNTSYPQDDLPGAEHLGAFAAVPSGSGSTGEMLIGVSSWAPERYPGEPGDPRRPAVRLRGMAVEPDRQGQGVGEILVTVGIERWSPVAELVWAHARDSVIGFYERLGFVIVGEGFVDATTALAHHMVIKQLG